MLLFYQVATRLSLTTCWQIVELQDDSKLLEQLVTSLSSSTTFRQVVNKPLTTCQQAGNKQCEHILLTSCWNSIATSLLQVCYNLCVLVMCVPRDQLLQMCKALCIHVDRVVVNNKRNCSFFGLLWKISSLSILPNIDIKKHACVLKAYISAKPLKLILYSDQSTCIL
jgi:hypothetical protein